MSADESRYLGAKVLSWRIGRSTYRVIPEVGARLMTWDWAHSDGTRREVLHWPALSSLTEVPNCWGGNPILFPFAGRCFDQAEIHTWRDPAGIHRPMPNHGIARQGNFRLIDCDDFGFTAHFVPGAEAQSAYPFNYDFTVCYRFSDSGLSCRLELLNRGTQALPWCAGHHFYFKVPWNRVQPRSDHFVKVESGRRLTLTGTGALVSAPPFDDAEHLGTCSVTGTVHLDLRKPEAFLGLRSSVEGVTVHLGPDNLRRPSAAIVTWTPAADAPFYCVEPWMGPPNAPGSGFGVEWVAPGEKSTFGVTVGVQ